MAYHESGAAAKASELLAQAEAMYAEEAPEHGTDDLGSSWYTWLVCELLLEEAKGMAGRHREQDEADQGR
jgi:hypothetical protein